MQITQELYTVNDIANLLNLSKRRTQELILKYVRYNQNRVVTNDEFPHPFPYKDKNGAWVLTKAHVNNLMVKF